MQDQYEDRKSVTVLAPFLVAQTKSRLRDSRMTKKVLLLKFLI